MAYTVLKCELKSIYYLLRSFLFILETGQASGTAHVVGNDY